MPPADNNRNKKQNIPLHSPEEFLEFTVKLSRQCLIVRNDQRWLIKLCDDVRHRKGLTGTGHTEQSLELIAFLEASYQFFDCLGLITGWLVWGV